MSNRALTLASLGVLSGVAITLASFGLIQPTVAPSTVQFEAGGDTYGRRIDELRHAQLLREDDELLRIIAAFLDSGAIDGTA